MEANAENQIPENQKTPQKTDSEEFTLNKALNDIEFLKKELFDLKVEKVSKELGMSPEKVVREGFVEPPPSRIGRGCQKKRRPLLESEIREVVENSKVNCAAAAARMLGVSRITFRKYATKYGLYNPDPWGRGRKPRIFKPDSGKYPLSKILNGEMIHPKPFRLKTLLLDSGLKEKWCERCHWRESRPDKVLPLVVNFVDGNPNNQRLENMKLYCYNCTFVLRGYVRAGIVRFDDNETDE